MLIHRDYPKQRYCMQHVPKCFTHSTFFHGSFCGIGISNQVGQYNLVLLNKDLKDEEWKDYWYTFICLKVEYIFDEFTSHWILLCKKQRTYLGVTGRQTLSNAAKPQNWGQEARLDFQQANPSHDTMTGLHETQPQIPHTWSCFRWLHFWQEVKESDQRLETPKLKHKSEPKEDRGTKNYKGAFLN